MNAKYSMRARYWDARAALRSRDAKRIGRWLAGTLGINLAHPIDEITRRSIRVIREQEVDTVLDVGANVGQYAMSLRKGGYIGRIVSFEPLPDAHELLQAGATQDSAWEIYPRCALGATRGQAEIHVAANSYSSSLLEMTSTHVDAAPDSRYVAKVATEVWPLDMLPVAAIGGERLFLKIDTQGYELEVLKGAQLILQRVQAVQLELSLCSLYTGQPLFREVLDYLDALGFTLWTLLPGFEDKATSRTLQVEAILLRARR